jgi:hypothetical protein
MKWVDYADPLMPPLMPGEERRLSIERMTDGRSLVVDHTREGLRAYIGEVAVVVLSRDAIHGE